MNKTARYTISRIEIKAPIGWYEKEQQEGNVFWVDISYNAEFAHAANTDELSDAVDYEQICNTVEQCFQKKCRLLEQIALHVVSTLKEKFPSISDLDVKITKLRPPVSQRVEGISIEIKG
ncbi:MAG: dihydroneopterin aldolase [Flavobacteriales bacterium]|nr:dihydroneopterin aldolase [Flavobacteriales bacterium]